jgi:hypothetical protein
MGGMSTGVEALQVSVLHYRCSMYSSLVMWQTSILPHTLQYLMVGNSDCLHDPLLQLW